MNDLIRIIYGKKGTRCYDFSGRDIAKAIKKYKSGLIDDSSIPEGRLRLERVYKTLVFLAESKEQEIRIEDVSRHISVSSQVMGTYLHQIRYDIKGLKKF